MGDRRGWDEGWEGDKGEGWDEGQSGVGMGRDGMRDRGEGWNGGQGMGDRGEGRNGRQRGGVEWGQRGGVEWGTEGGNSVCWQNRLASPWSQTLFGSCVWVMFVVSVVNCWGTLLS
jgi:hypothetical protein